MKINTKLSSSATKDSTWRVKSPAGNAAAFPVDTMVMGYSMISEAGQSGTMLVSATCVLNNEKMRFGHTSRAQQKHPYVAVVLLKDIFQVRFGFLVNTCFCAS